MRGEEVEHGAPMSFGAAPAAAVALLDALGVGVPAVAEAPTGWRAQVRRQAWAMSTGRHHGLVETHGDGFMWAVGRVVDAGLTPMVASGWLPTREAAQAAAERAISAEELAPALTGWRELLDGELLWDGGEVVCKVLRARERWAWQDWSGGRIFASGHESAREAAQAKAERVIAAEEGAS
jgi:hypothetical protein